MTFPNNSSKSPRNNKTLPKASSTTPITTSTAMASPGRVGEDVLDMLCPICEEDCSCAGQTELRITKNKPKVKRHASSAVGSNPKKARTIGSLSKPPLKSTKGIFSPASLHDADALGTVAAAGPDASSNAGTKSALKPPPRRGQAPSISVPVPEAAIIKHREDLDVQYALSEFYFSSGSELEADSDDASVLEYENYLGATLMEEDAEDLLADYYGYSSGSDIALESLFLQSSSEEDTETDEELISHDDDDDLDSDSDSEAYSDESDESLTFPGAANVKPEDFKTPEEALSEQLAKITPQILAAISVAAKTLSAQNQQSSRRTSTSVNIPRSSYYGANAEEQRHFVDYYSSVQGKDTSIRFDEILDTKKLAVILSTSPQACLTPNYLEPQRRVVPLDAFRRSRRNSVQTAHAHAISNALRHNSINCTLADAPDHTELLLRRQRRAASEAAVATPFIADNVGQLTVEFEVHADNESTCSIGATDVEWEYEFPHSSEWWSTPALL